MRQALGKGSLRPEGEEVGGIDDLACSTLVDQRNAHRFLGEFMGMEQADRRLAIGPHRLFRTVVDFDCLFEIDAIERLRRCDFGRLVDLARQIAGRRRKTVERERFGSRKLKAQGSGLGGPMEG